MDSRIRKIQEVYFPTERMGDLDPILRSLGKIYVPNWDCGKELHHTGWGKIVIGDFEIHILNPLEDP